jgi:hypothetical protein
MKGEAREGNREKIAVFFTMDTPRRRERAWYEGWDKSN